MKKKVFIGIFLLVVGLCVYLTNRKSENYNVTMETSWENAETDTATVAADATSTAMIATTTASTTTEISTQVVTTGLAPTEVDKPVVTNKNENLTIRLHCDSADSSSATGASMLVPASVGYAKSITAVSGSYGLTILNSLVSTAGIRTGE